MRSLNPINSEKHIVQQTLSSVAAGAIGVVTIASAQQGASATVANTVEVGSVIKAVFVEMWLLASSQQPSTVTVGVEKISSGAFPPVAGDYTDLHTYANKKNMFETHQGLVGDANSNPIPFFRGWIKIPKGKQRFGLGDQLILAVKTITDDCQFCGMFIYKTYQ